MKRFLLIALTVGLSTPTASIAGRTWLILRAGNDGGYGARDLALEKIEVENMEQCELQGAKWKSGRRLQDGGSFLGYECLEGK